MNKITVKPKLHVIITHAYIHNLILTLSYEYTDYT